MSSNQLSRVVWSRFALTSHALDLQAQAVAFDGAASSHWPAAAAPSATWASTLIRACACGRIGSEVMWDILLAHADATTPPDVQVLLEHLPEAHARATLGELLDAQAVAPGPSPTVPARHPGRTDQRRDGEGPGGLAAASPGEHEDWFVMVESIGAA